MAISAYQRSLAASLAAIAGCIDNLRSEALIEALPPDERLEMLQGAEMAMLAVIDDSLASDD